MNNNNNNNSNQSVDNININNTNNTTTTNINYDEDNSNETTSIHYNDIYDYYIYRLDNINTNTSTNNAHSNNIRSKSGEKLNTSCLTNSNQQDSGECDQLDRSVANNNTSTSSSGLNLKNSSASYIDMNLNMNMNLNAKEVLMSKFNYTAKRVDKSKVKTFLNETVMQRIKNFTVSLVVSFFDASFLGC